MPPTLVSDGGSVIVAIDPGLTTGLACYRHQGLPVGTQFASGEAEGRFAFYDAFDAIVAWGHPVVVVMEKFTITGRTASNSPQYDPLYIIGAIERQAVKLGFPFEMQLPAQAMSFSTDAKLKAVGWYTPGKGHANDAARHLLRFLVGRRTEHGGQDLLDKLVEALGVGA